MPLIFPTSPPLMKLRHSVLSLKWSPDLTRLSLDLSSSPTQAGLVDGVVTEDSDIFLFGGKCVYKNIFEEKKYVEASLPCFPSVSLPLSVSVSVSLSLSLYVFFLSLCLSLSLSLSLSDADLLIRLILSMI
jgi:hypothetical protein